MRVRSFLCLITKKGSEDVVRLILDGNNLAYRARSSSMVLTTKKGVDVTTMYGTLRMLQSYIKPSHGGWTNKIVSEVRKHATPPSDEISEVYMCWDGGKSAYRKEVYPDYKGHREKKRAERTEEEKQDFYNFLGQMDILHKALPNFGIKSLKMQGWEADDLVGLVDHVKDDDKLTVVISNDRDMLQLVSKTTFVWMPGSEKLVTLDSFTDITGVTPEQYLDYRVMVGDKSDNINGILGIGDKKARALLLEYGSLSNALNNEEKLRKSKVTSRLFDNMDVLTRNIKLMNLTLSPAYAEDQVEVREEFAQALNEPAEFNEAWVRTFFMSNEFVSLLVDFENWKLPFYKLDYEEGD